MVNWENVSGTRFFYLTTVALRLFYTANLSRIQVMQRLKKSWHHNMSYPGICNMSRSLAPASHGGRERRGGNGEMGYRLSAARERRTC